MGKYLDIVRNFEGRQQAEDRTGTRREVRPSPRQAARPSISSLKATYRQTAETVAEDCFVIDPHWLIDHHPTFWKRLVWLDEQASAIEREGKSEEDYRNVLNRIAATVKEARRLYEASQDMERK